MNAKIWIEATGKTLRLVWYYQGQRVRLSLGVKDDSIGRALADRKMAEIRIDLDSGYYDSTLLKYKPRKLGKNPTEITAVELFDKYVKAVIDKKELARGSMDRYKAVASKLEQFLTDKLAEKVTESVANDVVVRWSESASPQTIKTYLRHLRAAWEWAKGKYHIADPNPWKNCLASRPRIKGSSKPKRKDPFTIAELQAIFVAFSTHKYYKCYLDFVIFLVNTGCRPGEAAGLRWKHITPDFATAEIVASISRGIQKGTKTEQERIVKPPATIREMLAARFDRLNPQPDDLVFPAPRGAAIDHHNFCNRIWGSILGSCNVRYRPPYNMRHSAISHALHSGAKPIELAEQTGHDVQTMLKTYAHAIDRECLFVDIKADISSNSES
jgi:integrase